MLLFSGGGGAGILATSALPGNKSQQRGICVEIHVYECAAPGRAHRPFWHSARPVPSGRYRLVPLFVFSLPIDWCWRRKFTLQICFSLINPFCLIACAQDLVTQFQNATDEGWCLLYAWFFYRPHPLDQSL